MIDSAWDTQMAQIEETRRNVSDLRSELSALLGHPIPATDNYILSAAEVVAEIRSLRERIEVLERHFPALPEQDGGR